MSMNQNVNRRRFLTTAAGAAVGVVGFPYIINSSALGQDGTPASNSRITMAASALAGPGVPKSLASVDL